MKDETSNRPVSLEDMALAIKDIERIRAQEAAEFQRTIYQALSQHKQPYHTEVLGEEFILFPGSFNPNYAKASMLLLKHMGVEKPDRVWIPFSGPGIDAILASKAGADEVEAWEKAENAHLNAVYNLHFHGIKEGVSLHNINVYHNHYPAQGHYDLVVANPPFKNAPAADDIEQTMNDQGYMALKWFWKKTEHALRHNGRVRMVFSDVGDMDYNLLLAKEHQFKPRIVASDKWGGLVNIHVYEFTKDRHKPQS